jgi:O-antigen ligase
MGVLGMEIETSPRGNLVDSTVYLTLIIAALIVLYSRRIAWRAFLSSNKLLILIYVYLVCTVAWADDGVSTAKRALRDFGAVPVALVLLTELDPIEAIRTVFVRVSYFIFTLSIIFIKWFPEIGRRPDRSGSSLFVGVTTHKNTLGLVVYVLSLFIIADISALQGQSPTRKHRVNLWIRYGMLAMAIWLLMTCDSMTSVICLTLGTAIFHGAKLATRLGAPRKVILAAIIVLILGAAIEGTFHVSGLILQAVGRNPTLTGRTEIWEMVEKTQTKPLLGYGYYSYWDSKEAAPIVAMFLGTLKTIHNGYLEMYIDTGVVGLALLLMLICQWGYRAVNHSLDASLKGRLGLAFWGISIIYNFSETSYFRAELLWFTLILLMIEYPQRALSPEARRPAT